MTRKIFFLLVVLMITCIFGARIVAWGASSAETEETFDRIVLKDMTVIKASLVKDLGDSLAYFELNDPDFNKHVVARDQVFKWIPATPAAGSRKVSPRKVEPLPAPAPAPEPIRVERQSIQPAVAPVTAMKKSRETALPAPTDNEKYVPVAKDSVEDGVPVVDYLSIVLGSSAAEKWSVRRTPPAPAAPVKTETALAAAPSREAAAVPTVDYNAIRDEASAAQKTPVKKSAAPVQKTASIDSSRTERQSPKSLAGAFAKRAKSPAAAESNASLSPTVAADTAVVEYDPNDAVPAGLTQVRLDPPTKLDGVKMVPRSGMDAINIVPSLSSLTVGYRSWTSKGSGIGVKAGLYWLTLSGFLVNAELMQVFNSRSQSRARWYYFFGAGYNWMTITTPELSMMGVTIPSTTSDIKLANLVLGIGGEWRVGINRNHGLAFELGYQYGKGDYTTKGFTYDYGYGSMWIPESKNTYKLSPIYFGSSYAYYF
jgi:hypothetical protein